MATLYEHIASLAQAEPTRPALLVCDTEGTVVEEISRAALLEKITFAASYLHSLGLRAGDRVALEMGNSADVLIISWAAWASGIVTVPLDTKRDTAEMSEFKIRASGAKKVIQKIEWAGRTNPVVWMPDTSHEALVLFTSGTTAHPKGALLTLQNLLTNAESIAQWLHISRDDRFLVVLPLHHINSTTLCLATLSAGASIAIPPQYSNSHFFGQAANSSATFTSIVPSIVFDQLSREKEFSLVNDRLKLNRIQLGSAPVVTSDVVEFRKKFSIPLYQGYGQTETALRVTGVPIDLAAPLYETLVAENSIGTPLSWAQVEVANEAGNILGEGGEGEIIIKGPAVMRGYIGGEPAFRDGYFLTGDIGYWKKIDGKQFFYLKGRAKEIIIKGGINISPVAVENALKGISSDIDQVYVVGVSDERYGEEVGAVVVWKSGIEQVAAMRRLKLLLLAGHDALSSYEAPKYLAAITSAQLPMTSTGKVQRTILRKNLEGAFESLYELMKSNDYTFAIISPQSALAEASHTLYNHCWQPLVKNADEYKKYLSEYMTLGAVNASGVLAGQISFSFKDKKISCVSICSAAFKPKPIPTVVETPSAEVVREYLLAGHDPVMDFHQKLGAELIEVTPNGRPEDKSSLGYTMLLRYPPSEATAITDRVPVSNQLIEAVRILAKDMDAEVFAISRPGGLAAYLAK